MSTRKETMETNFEIEKVIEIYNNYRYKVKMNNRFLENPSLTKKYKVEKLPQSNFKEIKSDFEKIEELKENKLEENKNYGKYIYRVESALEMVKKHKYYKVFEMRYLKKMTFDDIAEELNVDRATVFRRRKSIFKEIKPYFELQGLI